MVAHSGDTIVLGEAKVDPRLNSSDFVEKLRAWHDHPPDGFSRVVLALAVPAGWRLQAEEIAARAGWSHEDLRVLEVGLPDARRCRATSGALGAAAWTFASSGMRAWALSC